MTSLPTPTASAIESQGSGRSPGEVAARRELFWHNVIREILTALSVMSVQRSASVYDPHIEHIAHETFDGRLAVITSIGQRIPIKEVHPLFACSINGSEAQRQLSMDVQCSVFQIRTPGGEVHTLPVHEIRTFHALTPELMAQIERHAQQGQDGQQPFGFAAFTSMSKSGEGESAVPGISPVGEPEPGAASSWVPSAAGAMPGDWGSGDQHRGGSAVDPPAPRDEGDRGSGA